MKPAIKTIKVKDAPKAVGPYSQAVAANGFLFVSGQIPIDPDTGEMKPGDIGDQARCVIRNIRAVVEGAGVTLAQVVKVTIYLRDMGDFAEVNQVYAEYFTHLPARACVEVSGLPKGARVEMEAVAVLPEDG